MNDNWIPNNIYINNDKIESSKKISLFIDAWDDPKNTKKGPLHKQSVKEQFVRYNNKKLKIITNKNNIEFPQIIRYTPEPAASGSTHQKLEIQDKLKFTKINEPFYSKWIIIDKLYFVYPLPKNASHKEKELVKKGYYIPKLTTPDIDNLQKFLFDIFQNLNHNKKLSKKLPMPFISNDGIIFKINDMCKGYGCRAGTYIEMKGK